MYYERHEFFSLVESEDKLIVFHQNIRSFNRNYHTLSCFLHNLDAEIDVIVLSETWFGEHSCGHIEGYKGYHTSDKIKMVEECLFLFEKPFTHVWIRTWVHVQICTKPASLRLALTLLTKRRILLYLAFIDHL